MRLLHAIYLIVSFLDHAAVRLAIAVAHGVQRVTGVISYRLAQQLLMVEILRCAVLAADCYWVPGLLLADTSAMMLPLCVISIGIFLIIASFLGRAADQWQDSPNAVPAEALRVARDTVVFRLIVLMSRVPAFPFIVSHFLRGGIPMSDMAYEAAGLVLVLGLYVALVPPLPPARERKLVLAMSEG